MFSPPPPLSFSVSIGQALERGGMQASWTALQNLRQWYGGDATLPVTLFKIKPQVERKSWGEKPAPYPFALYISLYSSIPQQSILFTSVFYFILFYFIVYSMLLFFYIVYRTLLFLYLPMYFDCVCTWMYPLLWQPILPCGINKLSIYSLCWEGDQLQSAIPPEAARLKDP